MPDAEAAQPDWKKSQLENDNPKNYKSNRKSR